MVSKSPAPIGSLSKIQLAPADSPRHHPIDGTLLELIAMQLKLEQDIVARKALFKNLSPGRYEVRDKASGQVRVVEIVAGKTIELDFDAKPLPKNPDPAPSQRRRASSSRKASTDPPAQRPAGALCEGLTSRAPSPFSGASISAHRT